jgi:hypothetical protein
MKPLYNPPAGVIQLSYNISSKLVQELHKFSTIAGNQRIVRIKLSKQSDRCYKLFMEHNTDIAIANFKNDRTHVYLKVLAIDRVFNPELGCHYKLYVRVLEELPK